MFSHLPLSPIPLFPPLPSPFLSRSFVRALARARARALSPAPFIVLSLSSFLCLFFLVSLLLLSLSHTHARTCACTHATDFDADARTYNDLNFLAPAAKPFRLLYSYLVFHTQQISTRKHEHTMT